MYSSYGLEDNRTRNINTILKFVASTSISFFFVCVCVHRISNKDKTQNVKMIHGVN